MPWGNCDVCENFAVLIRDTGMCGACCFGEADALTEFDDYNDKE